MRINANNTNNYNYNYNIDGRYMFVPIAFENLGVPNASAKLLLTHFGRRLVTEMLNILQRFNAVLLHDSMPACDRVEF